MNNKINFNLISAVILTLIYFLYCYSIFSPSSLSKEELSYLGSFLSGVFAPPAFIWLIYGYFQQGQELKQNTEALKLQSQELANLVKQQEDLNEIHKTQLHIKRIESKPILNFKNATYIYTIFDQDEDYFEGTFFYFEIINFGNIAKDITITGKGVEVLLFKLETDVSTTIRFNYSSSMEKELSKFQGKPLFIKLDITYCDNSGHQYHNKIELSTNEFVLGAVNVEWKMEIENKNLD